MPLTKMSPLLQKAANEGYAVGSFSVANMEMVLGVLKAVEETESPAIIQIAEVRLKQSPLRGDRPADGSRRKELQDARGSPLRPRQDRGEDNRGS